MQAVFPPVGTCAGGFCAFFAERKRALFGQVGYSVSLVSTVGQSVYLFSSFLGSSSVFLRCGHPSATPAEQGGGEFGGKKGGKDPIHGCSRMSWKIRPRRDCTLRYRVAYGVRSTAGYAPNCPTYPTATLSHSLPPNHSPAHTHPCWRLTTPLSKKVRMPPTFRVYSSPRIRKLILGVATT